MEFKRSDSDIQRQIEEQRRIEDEYDNYRCKMYDDAIKHFEKTGIIRDGYVKTPEGKRYSHPPFNLIMSPIIPVYWLNLSS